MTGNVMKNIKIEKVVFSIGGSGDSLEKGVKLLKLITGRNPARMQSRKRIPAFGVRPKLEVGALVTLRKNVDDAIKRMLVTKENVLRKNQVSDNGFSFGVKEYIEIPGMEYQRDIGIRGLDFTITFTRAGKRVKLKKVKQGRIPRRNIVTKEEIIKFMEEKFKTKFV